MAENKKQTPRGGVKINMGLVWMVIIGGLLIYNFMGGGDGKLSRIDSREFFEKILPSGDVQRVAVVNREVVNVSLTENGVKKYQGITQYSDIPSTGSQFYFMIGDLALFEGEYSVVSAELVGEGVMAPALEFERVDGGFWDSLFGIMPFLLMVAFFILMFRRMGGGSGSGGGGGSNMFNVGKSKAKLFDKDSDCKVLIKDVAGLEEAKVEVMEIVDFLKNPQKYKELGGKIPKGALLVGPPGTGKTLLAKAVAGEAGVPFFSMSGSDFVEMFVGVGASRVRDLFATAKAKSPCIVFIDEIDAIGRARGKNSGMSSNDERENTLNQLLTEMDGFGTNAGVIVLAATNRADILDKALLRAGRFDRQIHVDLPERQERQAIFDVYLKKLKLESGLDTSFLAKQTPGFSGADIANTCNEAALIAARCGKKAVSRQDFLDAVDRIIGGLERKSKVFKAEEKRAIAYHEAGHATVSWFLEHASPLLKVTIIPRGRALGAAWYLPDERQITTRGQMFHEMASLLGGRAAEELTFGEISSGALNDLERATKQAYAMVAYYGMSEKLGNRSYYDSQSGDMSFTKPYSDNTAELIDSEVKAMLDEQYQVAIGILRDKQAGLEKVASLLLEREVIFAEDLEEIYGKRQWQPTDEEQQLQAAEKCVEKTNRADAEKAQAGEETATTEEASIEIAKAEEKQE